MSIKISTGNSQKSSPKIRLFGKAASFKNNHVDSKNFMHVKVLLSVCLDKHTDMKPYWGVEV
jgi:hypothetical protein